MNLDKDKLVIEELSRMKSLFGYERGKVISEQGLAGNASSGQASGGQLYGRTYNYDTAPASPMASLQTQRQFAQAMSQGGQLGFEDYPIVDCSGIVKIPMVPPGGKEQKEFMKNSGLNPNSEENKKYYCSSDAMKSYLAQLKKTTNQNTKKATAAPPQIPSELKDINGVKAFQDWLDENKAGWASGYANGVLNKLGKGYGRMGPRTTKAWGLFKDEYLNPQKLTQDIPDITTQEIQQINAGTQSKSDLGTQAPVTNTTTTTTSTETISQYPPDEPGQPGEYKDGWYYDEKSQQWYKPQ
jgi:hypothetical protein